MIRRILVTALVLALAACAQAPAPVPVPQAPPPPAAPPPAVPIPPPPPRGQPSGYLNLPAANIRGLFGTPQFIRQDGATQMWRYDGNSCRAFFFFNGPKGAETVNHVETLPAGAASAADPLCLNALKKTS